jgi:hypothetical protein
MKRVSMVFLHSLVPFARGHGPGIEGEVVVRPELRMLAVREPLEPA